MKAVGKKAAKHERNLLTGSAIRQACSNIVFVAIQPGRTYDLIALAVPCFGNKTPQRDVPARESRSGIRDLVVVIRAGLVLAGSD